MIENQLEDVRVIKECLEGNVKVYENLIERYQKPIYNLAYRMVGNSDDAEDITQTAFIKAYEKLNTYNFKNKFFSWLYRIAMNESINFINARKRLSRMDENPVSYEDNPEQSLIHSDTRNKVRMAVQELKEEYKTVVILKHFNDLSYEEIAEVLNISEKMVKSRLYTARQLLKEKLIDGGI
jgi:RNA polymerase sigma-70 factor, ECF subfamily